ncbi:MAG: hypothetical protein EOM22_03865 [Gammaproteobacteria bacterium]|nr:hypothetical protein [Gammaproteobacteria bacterium]
MATPITQKYRPIGLALVTNPFGFDIPILGDLLQVPVWGHVFSIRPEEMQYTHPTRNTVVQTFGGAWADDWGEGVKEVTIQGHTGWRGGLVPGELEWHNIKRLVFDAFHLGRRSLSQAGADPDIIKMYLIDVLNVHVYEVYPTEYRLRRHRQRPLLYQYTIRLHVMRPWV